MNLFTFFFFLLVFINCFSKRDLTVEITWSLKRMRASESNINVFLADDSLKISTRIFEESKVGNLKIKIHLRLWIDYALQV